MATIYHQVWINAPVAKVYEAVSTVDGISSWWGKQTANETEAGLVLEHNPGPMHGVVKLKVLELNPNKRVEWECISTHSKSSPASAWTGTHFSFDLSERSNVAAMSGFGQDGDRITILDFRQTGYDEQSEYFGFNNFAWGCVLQMLQKWCESRYCAAYNGGQGGTYLRGQGEGQGGVFEKLNYKNGKGWMVKFL